MLYPTELRDHAACDGGHTMRKGERYALSCLQTIEQSFLPDFCLPKHPSSNLSSAQSTPNTIFLAESEKLPNIPHVVKPISRSIQKSWAPGQCNSIGIMLPSSQGKALQRAMQALLQGTADTVWHPMLLLFPHQLLLNSV